jgi:nuclear transport factor 2 (NTF2) superfamily protein
MTTIVPPFTLESATAKVQLAEDAWNSRDPQRVSMAYTEHSEWRNRADCLNGRDAIRAFLTRKWAREHEYRLKKTLWAFGDDRIAVRFEYEWHDDDGQWWRACVRRVVTIDYLGCRARCGMTACRS